MLQEEYPIKLWKKKNDDNNNNNKKHYIKNIFLYIFPSAIFYAVLEGESRHESSVKQKQAAVFVSDILEKLALSPHSVYQSPLKITRSLLIL